MLGNTNPLHPVTNVNFLEIALWCNALSLLIETEPYYLVEDGSGILEVCPSVHVGCSARGQVLASFHRIRVLTETNGYAARVVDAKDLSQGNESANGKAIISSELDNRTETASEPIRQTVLG